MSMEWDAQGDLAQIGDGIEAVTLRRRDSNATVSVEAAIRRHEVEQELQASGGAAMRTDIAWHLPLATGEAAPKIGDAVVDSNDQRWTILEVRHLPLLGRWRCEARNLRVAFGCSDRVNVQRAVWEDLGSGPEITGWNYLRTALPVKIQPTSFVVDNAVAPPVGRSHFDLILSEPLSLETGDRFAAEDGTLYVLESYEQADRIDTLPVAKVVLEPPTVAS